MHLHLLSFDNLEYTSDLSRSIMSNFLISYNYLKNAFILEKVPFPAEPDTILEPASITTIMQSSTNSNSTVGRPNVISVLLCCFEDSVVLLSVTIKRWSSLML